MRFRLLSALVLFGMSVAARTACAQVPAWRMHVNPIDSTAYRIEGDQTPMNAPGAVLSFRSIRTPAPSAWAAFSLVVPTDTFASHVISLSAEIRTVDAPLGAIMSITVADSTRMLVFENTRDRPVRGNSEWTPVRLVARADARAKRFGFGLMLNGGGQAELRNVRIDAVPLSALVTSASAEAYLDTAIARVKRIAYWSDTVSWPIVEAEVRTLARGATTTEDTYPAIRKLLSSLGDHHSGFLTPAATASMMLRRPTGTAATAYAPVVVRSLSDGVALVQMPGYGLSDTAVARQYTEELHAKLKGTLAHATCGWVVDLRNNTGGNMWPMLAGLEPFLGSGPLGSFKSRANVLSEAWRARRPGAAAPPTELLSLENARVAVLTGPRTASSGEAVTIAFRGRANTRSFGLPTNGLANANSTVRLSDGAIMLVMSMFDVDRNGVVFGEKVDPDEVVSGIPGVADATLDATQRWLVQSCRRPQ